MKQDGRKYFDDFSALCVCVHVLLCGVFLPCQHLFSPDFRFGGDFSHCVPALNMKST